MTNVDLLKRYSRHVFYSQRDEGWIAICPEFPGLSAFGNTREESLAQLDVALELAIDTYEEEGWPLPEPEALPESRLPSGEFRVRLPRSLHANLNRQAKFDGVSQNSLVISYISAGLALDGFGKEIERRVSLLVNRVGSMESQIVDISHYWTRALTQTLSVVQAETEPGGGSYLANLGARTGGVTLPATANAIQHRRSERN